MTNRALELLEALNGEIASKRAHDAWVRAGSKGMSVPFHGNFSSATPSVLSRLDWWCRELRAAFTEELDAAEKRGELKGLLWVNQLTREYPPNEVRERISKRLAQLRAESESTDG